MSLPLLNFLSMASTLILMLTIIVFVLDGNTTGALTCHDGSDNRVAVDTYPPLPPTKDNCVSCWKFSMLGRPFAFKATGRMSMWRCDSQHCGAVKNGNGCQETKFNNSLLTGVSFHCCCDDKDLCNGGIGVVPMIGCLILALGALWAVQIDLTEP